MRRPSADAVAGNGWDGERVEQVVLPALTPTLALPPTLAPPPCGGGDILEPQQQHMIPGPWSVRQGHLLLSPGGALRLWTDEEDDTQWRQGQFHGIRTSMVGYGPSFDRSHIPKTLAFIGLRITVQALTPHAPVWHPQPVV